MKSGFSLIELLITIAIITIFSCIAYPNYHQYIIRSHRIDGQHALINVAIQLEQYYAKHHTYQHALPQPIISPGGFYQIKLAATTDNTFILYAIARKTDSLCSMLTLNEQGERGTIPAKPNTLKLCWS